jgi:hypothetical protein
MVLVCYINNKCVRNIYFFSLFKDPLIGCEDCQCRIEGVINGRLECDLRSGQCPCRDNIGGRTCDRCAPGLMNNSNTNFYLFLQVIMIIRVVLNVIVIQLAHLNPSVIHTQVLVYVKKMFMDHDVIDVLMEHLLYYLTIQKDVQIVIVLVQQHNVIQVCLIIELFVICPTGH